MENQGMLNYLLKGYRIMQSDTVHKIIQLKIANIKTNSSLSSNSRANGSKNSKTYFQKNIRKIW